MPLWFPEPPLPPPVFSRWREGATTFGPVGRIVTTAVVLTLWVVGFLIVKAASFLGISGWLAYSVIASVVLKEVWKRDRVR